MLAVQLDPQLVDGQRFVDRRDSGLEADGGHSFCVPRSAIGVFGALLPPPEPVDGACVVVGDVDPPGPVPGKVVDS